MAASDGGDFAANLSPAMPRSENQMDAFLVTIGAKATPFSVSDMFAGANSSRRNVENRCMSNMEQGLAPMAGAGDTRLPRRCSVLYPPSPEG